jgi:hypothetical protein
MKTLDEQLTITQLRKIITVCNDLGIDTREVVNHIYDNDNDFEVDNYRFLSESEIDKIQKDELSSDTYILGCFNAWFIADHTDLSLDIVEALQSAEKYEEIGKHILDNGYIDDIQENYAAMDGYGHHFSSYDGNTIEDLIGLDDLTSYYIFRIN